MPRLIYTTRFKRANRNDYLSKLDERQRKLKEEPTPAERALFPLLKSVFQKHKIYNQYVIQGRRYYILDFFIPELKLCFEADGAHHEFGEQSDRDLLRDSNLADLGIRMVRFPNWAIIHEKEKILKLLSLMRTTMENRLSTNKFQETINNALGWRSGQRPESIPRERLEFVSPAECNVTQQRPSADIGTRPFYTPPSR